MPRISELFFRSAILFLIVGIGLGLQMSISQNHNVIGAHAHINLLGWVTSAIFGGYYALNPAKATGLLPLVQYWVYTIGVVVMAISLYLLLTGNTAPSSRSSPAVRYSPSPVFCFSPGSSGCPPIRLSWPIPPNSRNRAPPTRGRRSATASTDDVASGPTPATSLPILTFARFFGPVAN
jgi:hypothetical protein